LFFGKFVADLLTVTQFWVNSAILFHKSMKKAKKTVHLLSISKICGRPSVGLEAIGLLTDY